MKESNLKLAQKDIDEALKAVEEMESYINEGKEKNKEQHLHQGIISPDAFLPSSFCEAAPFFPESSSPHPRR